MQTLRAYGIGGVKNEAIVDSMREYSDVSFWYEAALIPLGAVMSIIVGLCQPLLFLMCGAAYLDGALGAVPYLLIIMLPLFMNKVWNSIFVNLTAYKNLMIAKRRIQAVVDEPEEAGSFDALPATGSRIELADVGFAYCKGEPVFEGLRLTCEDGKLTALVGDSGCGKSTALNLIAQYYRPARGTVRIGGEDVWENAALKARIAAIPDDWYYFLQSSIRDMMRFYRGFYPAFSMERYEKLKEVFQLDEKRPIRRLSKGMQKQAAFWLALCCMPDYLILDEPVDGLDPVMRRQVWSLVLADVAQRGTTVLVSSHNLRELEDVCDHVGIMDHGRVLLERSLAQLQDNMVKLQVVFPDGMTEVPSDLPVLHASQIGRIHTFIMRMSAQEAEDRLAAYSPLLVDAVPLTLEEIFIYELGGADYAVKDIVL